MKILHPILLIFLYIFSLRFWSHSVATFGEVICNNNQIVVAEILDTEPSDCRIDPRCVQAPGSIEFSVNVVEVLGTGATESNGKIYKYFSVGDKPNLTLSINNFIDMLPNRTIPLTKSMSNELLVGKTYIFTVIPYDNIYGAGIWGISQKEKIIEVIKNGFFGGKCLKP